MAIDDRDVSENSGEAPKTEATPLPPAAGTSLSRKGASRRRFARASAGATGVLLTLHSQPGMACTFCGISPSLAVSAVGQNRNITALSHRPTASRCVGIPPETWKTQSNWPCNPDARFSNVFTCQARTAGYANATIREIINGASCDTDQMAKYMMAAYMNVADGKVDFITFEALAAVWNEWSIKGYYEPMAGQKWGTYEILYYLRGTMD